jgi:hypothetical protein
MAGITGNVKNVLPSIQAMIRCLVKRIALPDNVIQVACTAITDPPQNRRIAYG